MLVVGIKVAGQLTLGWEGYPTLYWAGGGGASVVTGVFLSEPGRQKRQSQGEI